MLWSLQIPSLPLPIFCAQRQTEPWKHELAQEHIDIIQVNLPVGLHESPNLGIGQIPGFSDILLTHAVGLFTVDDIACLLE